jgi:hypothetical protein
MRHAFCAVPGVGLVLLLSAGIVPVAEAAARPAVVSHTPGRPSSTPGPDAGSMPGMAPGSMPGMDPVSTPSRTSSPAPTAAVTAGAGSMPGMGPGSMPGMAPIGGGAVSRPRGLVLGGFAGLNAAVLLAAALLRRRTADRRRRPQTSRERAPRVRTSVPTARG